MFSARVLDEPNYIVSTSDELISRSKKPYNTTLNCQNEMPQNNIGPYHNDTNCNYCYLGPSGIYNNTISSQNIRNCSSDPTNPVNIPRILRNPHENPDNAFNYTKTNIYENKRYQTSDDIELIKNNLKVLKEKINNFITSGNSNENFSNNEELSDEKKLCKKLTKANQQLTMVIYLLIFFIALTIIISLVQNMKSKKIMFIPFASSSNINNPQNVSNTPDVFVS